MRKELFCNGVCIAYELQRKQVKNLNLRVRADGSIHVSAHPRVPLAVIEDFLRLRADFILQAQQRLQKERPLQGLEEGERFPLLGRAYTLHLLPGEKLRAEVCRETILLYGGESAQREQKKKALATLCRREGERMAPALCRALCEKNFPGLALPEISLRSMKSRWGSCQPGKGKITLNTWLFTAPEASVEYVLLHELCHFLQPNHSPAFYRELESRMPDWKDRKKCLSNYGKYLL